jgi:hypothetical protein
MKAWRLLLRNPMMIAVCVLAGLASSASELLVDGAMSSFAISGNGSRGALDAITIFTRILLFVAALIVSLVQMAYVTGMAGAAWRTGHATLADGWDALSHRILALAGAAVLLIAMGFCAAVLAPITFGITLLIYAVFFIYTIAAVVIGERPPIAGITQSASLALANMLPTIGIVLLVVAVSYAGAIVGHLISGLNRDAGWLVAALLQQVIVAYAALVVAGEYLTLASRQADCGS